ncbi:hypothetical protein MASR1M60_06120 [Rhodocyclaceae bacterium]
MTGNEMTARAVRGFSLIELMIVMAIIAILTSIALPAYNDYVIKGKLVEAHGELAAMRTKLENYLLDNRTYDCSGVAALPTNGRYFTYACSNLSASTYTVTATGVAAQGTGGFVYTINQANVRATTAVPSGWTANPACWVTKKAGTC